MIEKSWKGVENRGFIQVKTKRKGIQSKFCCNLNIIDSFVSSKLYYSHRKRLGLII